MHNSKVTNIQLEVKENSAHNTKLRHNTNSQRNSARNIKVTNIQLHVKENSAHNTNVTKIQQRKQCT